MGLKDEAKAAEQQLRGWLAGLPTHLTALTTILRYNGELRSNLQLARTDVERLTSESKASKDRAIAAEAALDGHLTTIESLKQQLAGAERQIREAAVAAVTAAVSVAEDEIAASPNGSIQQIQLNTLRPGAKLASGTAENWRERREQLIRVVERLLPQHAEAVETPADVVLLHQDAYAGGYHADEYALLGMAIKYAGLHGRKVTIIGTNGETFKEPRLEETARTRADKRPWYRRMWKRSR